MVPNVTMLELVQTVTEFADTDNEVVATVAHMINTGLVRLIGNFRNCTVVLDDDFAVVAA